MREQIAAAMKSAATGEDRCRLGTLRLICATIKDREQASRGLGRDGVSEEEILCLLRTMVKQREDQAREYEEAAQVELAAAERREIEVIREFLPPQLDEGQMRSVCAEVVGEIGAHGLRDVGRAMSALKARYPGRMDFGRASSVVKELLG